MVARCRAEKIHIELRVYRHTTGSPLKFSRCLNSNSLPTSRINLIYKINRFLETLIPGKTIRLDMQWRFQIRDVNMVELIE